MLSNKVSEIMNREVITAEASSTILEVMELMLLKEVGRVVITENKAPAGIFTEKDVLKRVMNQQLDPKKTSIKRVMTSPIRMVREDTHIVEALGKMYRGKFRHLLVRGARGGMVGMVSMRRILKLAVELGEGLKETQTVGTIMSTNPTTVDASLSIYSTIETMIREDKVCVVVLSAGAPQGIFTERDVLKRVALRSLDTKKTAVREVTTADLVTAPKSALIGEVLAKMYKGDCRNMPILGEKGDLVGIVSMSDVLQYAKALDVDESVRRTWKEIEEFWDSEVHYTPG